VEINNNKFFQILTTKFNYLIGKHEVYAFMVAIVSVCVGNGNFYRRPSERCEHDLWVTWLY